MKQLWSRHMDRVSSKDLGIGSMFDPGTRDRLLLERRMYAFRASILWTLCAFIAWHWGQANPARGIVALWFLLGVHDYIAALTFDRRLQEMDR